MNLDLVAQAERRAALASTLGRLVLTEPGPELGPLVAELPALHPLADPQLAVDYERIFLRSVPPYESIFRGHDARGGGPIAAAVARAFDEDGFGEHHSGRWRVAGADHLGLQLRFHAHLVGREVTAWRADRPDEAAGAVESERRFLGDHLARWAGVVLDALHAESAESPYGAVVDLTAEFLAEEYERLRPAPILAGADAPTAAAVVAPPTVARLARYLLAPARSGIWFSVRDLADAAARVGFPWRAMDGRGRLAQLVEAAHAAGELATLVEPLRRTAVEASRRWREQSERQPGIAAIWRQWHARADATAELLGHTPDDAVGRCDERSVLLRVTGRDVDGALAVLEQAGFSVETVEDAGPDQRDTPDGRAVAAGVRSPAERPMPVPSRRDHGLG